ncbi:unnamed protein product [Urochloa humidicola]
MATPSCRRLEREQGGRIVGFCSRRDEDGDDDGG